MHCWLTMQNLHLYKCMKYGKKLKNLTCLSFSVCVCHFLLKYILPNSKKKKKKCTFCSVQTKLTKIKLSSVFTSSLSPYLSLTMIAVNARASPYTLPPSFLLLTLFTCCPPPLFPPLSFSGLSGTSHKDDIKSFTVCERN